MRYWDSPEGCRKKLVVAAKSRARRLTQTQPASKARGNIGAYTARKNAEIKEIKRGFNYCCVACGSHGPLTRDHVMPTKRFGSSAPENIQPLCRPCNERKHLKSTDYRLNPHPHCLSP